MKAKKIYYKKLFNLGNYEHTEVGIELEVEENETAKDVMKKAVEFVELFDPNINRTERIKVLKNMIDNPRSYKYGDIQDAKKELEKLLKEEEENDLPF